MKIYIFEINIYCKAVINYYMCKDTDTNIFIRMLRLEKGVIKFAYLSSKFLSENPFFLSLNNGRFGLYIIETDTCTQRKITCSVDNKI